MKLVKIPRILLFLLIFAIGFLTPNQQVSSEGSIPDSEDPRLLSMRDAPSWPMELFVPISGTFCEFRNYNMHMGADFKSYGLNGHRILATWDGYIDHLSQSAKGYGISINLYSPKWKVKTKYAHLHSVLGQDGRLELLRQATELLTGDGEFSLKLPPNLFPTKRGDWIGLTGESGSGISHLHLEFRDELGFINPLFFTEYRQKDTTPPTILKLILEESGSEESREWVVENSGWGSYKLPDRIVADGKIRIKVGGYDLIRSANKNNIYAFYLYESGKEIFRKKFFYVPYKDSSNRQEFYDINRSSLNPPVYFYNLFRGKNEYSYDLTSYPPGYEVNLTAILEDAAGNRAELLIPIRVGKRVERDKKQKEILTQKGSRYKSSDSRVSLDFTKNETWGNGSPKIEITTWKKEGIPTPKGLAPKGQAYKITGGLFNWKGEASGSFLWKPGSDSKESKDSLYFYDLSIKRFTSVSPKRTKDGFSFRMSKFGILGVFSDESPPSVTYNFSLAREIQRREASLPGIEERLYYLSDIGSGFTSNPEVLLEGEPYPYTYDPDRKAIRIQFPKQAFQSKRYLLLQIKPKDRAGNIGSVFTELITEGN